MALRAAVIGVVATLALVSVASAQSQRTATKSSAEPQTRREWVRAAWGALARHREVPAEMPDRAGRFETLIDIKLMRDGTLVDAEIRRSSGRAVLDSSAMRMVARSSPFPPLPRDMSPSETLTLPVVFEFEQNLDQERTVIDAPSLYQSRRLMDRRRAADRL